MTRSNMLDVSSLETITSFSRTNRIALVDVSAPVWNGTDFACEDGNLLTDSIQMRPRPSPHWPVSEVRDGDDHIIIPRLALSSDTRLQLHMDHSPGWAHGGSQYIIFEQPSPRELSISMHVHGINDYGLNILDVEYEERSEVTSFLSDVETIASLDCSSEDGCSFAASIDSDLSTRITDVIDDSPTIMTMTMNYSGRNSTASRSTMS